LTYFWQEFNSSRLIIGVELVDLRKETSQPKNLTREVLTMADPNGFQDKLLVVDS